MTGKTGPAAARRAARAARPARRPGSGDPARRAAFDVLAAVGQRSAYANLLLPRLLAERGLTGRDAAFATELCYGTLRGQGTYDAVLAECSDRDPGQVDPPVRDVLRLGTHQLLATRVKPHAAVASSVDLAREVAGPAPAGFVNAVLRQVASRDLAAWVAAVAPARAADPAGHLAVRFSHPRWIVTALSHALGEDEAGPLTRTEAALAADNTPPRVSLAAIPGLASPAELVTGRSGQPARWSPFGAYLDQGDPGGVPAVAQRRAVVQDEASQLAAQALAGAELAGGPDRRWLDACAGPGGKATLLAGLAARRRARLLAADLREHRAGLARSAAAGTGRAGVVTADAAVPPWRPGTFDRVLADVPCSGLGALRRRPEARWRKTPADVAALAGLQRRLLGAAVAAARPGGVIAYVTCTPHVAETREVVADVTAARGDVVLLDAPGVLAEVPGLRCPAPDGRYAQFWPHVHGTDAIFIALLRRAAG
ncbi:MAG: rRNA cytosine-C5-methyltransferase [Nocardiopsaceae bacterium]|jgi:16S rRNA (cytosine967-C5)-methyltransferase|nr:rRNA cytosine-C5-methyltransferase [Nocardiopsaceae bacterium]